ncbi:MAG: aspartate-semialdehyde dehydrogenase [Lachnospiraceae bacterium]|nr:aspartate-semialdehyde dehydrogenase [Lachnospiraceae bacterium]
MKTYNVAILGATGAVGREMMKVMEEYDFPVGDLKLLASARSAGKTLVFKGKELTVEEAAHDSFKGCDFVLGATSNALAKEMAPYIVEAGATFIDNSSAFRMDPKVPLVVPEINPEDVKWSSGIIANPNCTTIITLMAIYALNKISPVTTIIASSYQASSGAGAAGPVELKDGARHYLENGSYEGFEPHTFRHPLAFNVIPEIGSESDVEGYTTEEMKMQNEGRKILQLPELKVSCTCVRVPVVRSHAISAVIRTKDVITVEQAKEVISKAAGVRLVDDLKNHVYPMPLDTSDQDTVFVGRIRRDLTDDHGLNIWCCGDQVRKGAAANAVQIMELLVR